VPFLGEPSLSDARAVAAAGDAELLALKKARGAFHGDLAQLDPAWDAELADLERNWAAAKAALGSIFARTGIPESMVPAAGEYGKLARLAPQTRLLAARLKKLGGIAEFGAMPGHQVGDVLAYRRMWDPYVLSVARALLAAGDAWEHRSPGINENILSPAAAGNPKTFDRIAAAYRQYAQDLMSSWNAHAGLPSQDIFLQSSAILADEQAVVDRIGSFYLPQLRRDAPGLSLPDPPSFDLQRSVVAELEGAGIAAKGILHIVGTALWNAPQAAASWLTAGIVPLPHPEGRAGLPPEPPKPKEIPWTAIGAGAAIVTALLASLAYAKKEFVG
jgi:hypothetical protein